MRMKMDQKILSCTGDSKSGEKKVEMVTEGNGSGTLPWATLVDPTTHLISVDQILPSQYVISIHSSYSVPKCHLQIINQDDKPQIFSFKIDILI